MDEMSIVSKFTTSIVSKLVEKVLRKKTGYDVNIQLNDVRAYYSNEKAHVHLDVDAELDKEELMRIIKSIGLD